MPIPHFNSSGANKAAHDHSQPWEFQDQAADMKPLDMFRYAEAYHEEAMRLGDSDKSFSAAKNKFITAYGPNKDEMGYLNKTPSVTKLAENVPNALNATLVCEVMFDLLAQSMADLRSVVDENLPVLNSALSDMPNVDETSEYNAAIIDIQNAIDHINPKIVEFHKNVNIAIAALHKLGINVPGMPTPDESKINPLVLKGAEGMTDTIMNGITALAKLTTDAKDFEPLEKVFKGAGALAGAPWVLMDTLDKIKEGESVPRAITAAGGSSIAGWILGGKLEEKVSENWENWAKSGIKYISKFGSRFGIIGETAEDGALAGSIAEPGVGTAVGLVGGTVAGILISIGADKLIEKGWDMGESLWKKASSWF